MEFRIYFLIIASILIGCTKEEMNSGIQIITAERGCQEFKFNPIFIGGWFEIRDANDELVLEKEIQDSIVALKRLLEYDQPYTISVIDRDNTTFSFMISSPLSSIFGEYELEGEEITYVDFEVIRRRQVKKQLTITPSDTTEADVLLGAYATGLETRKGTSCDSIEALSLVFMEYVGDASGTTLTVSVSRSSNEAKIVYSVWRRRYEHVSDRRQTFYVTLE